MKKLKRKSLNVIILCFLILVIDVSKSIGQDRQLLAYYECTISLKTPLKKDGKLKVVSNFGDTTVTDYSLPTTIDVLHIISKFKVLSTSNSTTIYAPFEISKSWKNSEKIIVDSVKLISNSWYSYKDGTSIRIGAKKIYFTETGERKRILGYNCKKIIGFYENDGAICELWVSDELPRTLIPTKELIPTFGGILACKFLSSGISIQAISILSL